MNKKRAPLNRTLTVNPGEEELFSEYLYTGKVPDNPDKISNKLIVNDLFRIIDVLPEAFADLVFIDPPYNLSKIFNEIRFRKMEETVYEEWIDSWLSKIVRLLKPTASVYICCDWKSSPAVYNAAKKYFFIRNRITWEREKGRGAASNWKNCLEDIWFCTLAEQYTFNIDSVKMRRKVIAPYKDNNGAPKGWNDGDILKTRDTHPSNLWTDITVPFWSMPENTDHPTQKPEKLLAKIILASSNPGDMIFDPFAGSGTTLVTAKKLDRKFSGVEIDQAYAALAAKRLHIAETDRTIQGYSDGVFWERNSASKK
jgi:site-specific DNA-methyltransferase (adenine-specific)